MLDKVKRASTYPGRLWWDLEVENTTYVFCMSTCRVHDIDQRERKTILS